MRMIFFIAVAFLSKDIYSQADSIINSKISIKIAPLPLIDIVSKTSYRAGIEFRIYEKTSLYIEGGGFFPNYNASNVKGFIVKGEIKRYLNKNNLTAGNFISIEYLFMKQSYNYWDSITLTPAYIKDYTIYKKINCLSLKYGKLKVFKSHFIFEYSFGLGVRLKNATSNLSKEEADHRYYGGDQGGSIVNQLNNQLGMHLLPNFSGGIKIGYQIQ